MMSRQRIIIIVSMIIQLVRISNTTSICPSGSGEFSSFAMLPMDVLQWKSQTSDIFYRISNDSNTFKLNCYKLVDQSEAINPTVQIQNISTSASSTWEITAISEKGNCIGVVQETMFVAYSTASGSFVSTQEIDITGFKSYAKRQYNLNDNCSMIRILLTDQAGTVTTKVYREKTESASLALPSGTIFDSDYNYAIDTSSNFYMFENNAYVASKVSSLKSTPVLIAWSSKIKAVVTLSKDSSTYSLLVTDPLNPTNTFEKILTSGTDYTGDLKAFVIGESGTVILKSKEGLAYYVTFALSTSSLITATEYTLDSVSYKSFFNTDSMISISSDIVFVYNNKKVSYFQTYKGKIYHLGEIQSSIEDTLQAYNTQYSPKEISFVLSVTSPGSMEACEPIPVENSTNTTTEPVLNTDEAKAPTAVDETGAIIKCPDSCTGCTSAEVCTSCKVGYMLDQETGKCVFCDGCKSCNTKTPEICYSCFPPEVLNKQSLSCVLPACTGSNCLQCDLAGTCIKCLQGFSLVGGICQKCTVTGCKSCATSVDVCDLDSCVNGYVYYLNTKTNKTSCQTCAGGCDGCLKTDLSACITCVPGYYPQADEDDITRCLTCFTNCKVCSSATTCTKCATGYVPSSDKSKCELKCSDSCLTCDPTNADICLSCYAGSLLDLANKKCSVDMSCNTTGTCKTCQDKFAISSGYCVPCTFTDTNCMACSALKLSACTKCVTGTYLKSGVCNTCATNCMACVGAAACSKCSDGFYLITADGSDTGTCTACDNECKTCSGTSSTCTSCPDKYVLEGSKCISINRAVLSMVLQADVANMIEIMDELVDWFVKTINAGKAAGAADITARHVAISKIKKGSLVLDALISTGSSSGANTATAALSAAMSSSSGVQFGGYPMVSGSVSAAVQPDPVTPIDNSTSNNTNATDNTTNNNNTTTDPSTPQQPSSESTSNTVGIVLGIILPVVLLVIVGIVVIVYKKRQVEQENVAYLSPFDNDNERYSTKQFSYPSESEYKSQEKI